MERSGGEGRRGVRGCWVDPDGWKGGLTSLPLIVTVALLMSTKVCLKSTGPVRLNEALLNRSCVNQDEVE